jgi:propanediol dehydratase small subunit
LQSVHLEDLRKAQDAVERRAQLVAHAGRNSLFARFARSASSRAPFNAASESSAR